MNLFGDDIIDEPAIDMAAAIDVDLLSEPQSMSYIMGHEPQENLFLELLKKNSLPHAMIFSGLQGIGKSTMAFRLARFLLKNGGADNSDQDSLFGAPEPIEHRTLDVVPNDPIFHRVSSGGHVDLLHIHRIYDSTKGKLDASLKVTALRKIEPFLRKTASVEGGWRVVIVDDADTMNRNAQNAILKILEEPPSNVLIVLIAHRVGMLIPTIRSRARVISFEALPPYIMNEMLEKQGHELSINDSQVLHIISEGSIGKALSLIEDNGLDTLSSVLDHLSDFPNWNWSNIHKLSASLYSPSQDKEYRMFAEMMQWIFRQMLFAKARGDSSQLPAMLQQRLPNLIDAHSLEELIEISDGLKKHFDRVEFSNLDKRDAIRGSFLVIKA